MAAHDATWFTEGRLRMYEYDGEIGAGAMDHPLRCALTVSDVLRVHAEYGLLDRECVRVAMGGNWPPEWDAIKPGEGIFAPAAPIT